MLRFLFFFWLFVFFIPGMSQHTLPTGFVSEVLATELNPTNMAIADDGRIFFCQKHGAVRIVENDNLLEEPLLTVEVNNNVEKGLLGIALDPDFGLNGHLYIFFSSADEEYNLLYRYTVSGNHIVPDSDVKLLQIEMSGWSFHNGGAMKFGPDEKLYLTTGDGARPDLAQNFENLSGKILRFNRDGSIPEDNPYYDETDGIYRSIYALGVRNPFSMDIHPTTGRAFLCDVGSDHAEELNELLPGKNYGWPDVEGYANGKSVPANYQEPTVSYTHEAGCAAICANFYTTPKPTFPDRYREKLYYADYCQGILYLTDPDSTDRIPFMYGLSSPVSVATHPVNGAMYILERAQSVGFSDSGRLIKVQFTGGNTPFISVNPSPVLAAEGEDALFHIEALGQEPLFIDWLVNGDTVQSGTSDTLILSSVELGLDEAAIFASVRNDLDTVYSDSAQLSVVAGSRPTCTIEITTPETTYRAGDTIHFVGEATDPDVGELGGEVFFWKIDLHHNTHTHPALPTVSNRTEGDFPIALFGETDPNVWYRVHLTVRDQDGLTCSTYEDVHPTFDTLVFLTAPEGLSVTLDGKPVEHGDTIVGVSGMLRTVSGLTSAERDGKRFTFSHWLSGESERVHEFHLDGSHLFYAAYEEADYELYPNPSAGAMYVGLKEQFSNFEYAIFDVDGRVVKEGTYSGDENLVAPLFTDTMDNGLYFLRIIDDEGSHTIRFFYGALK